MFIATGFFSYKMVRPTSSIQKLLHVKSPPQNHWLKDTFLNSVLNTEPGKCFSDIIKEEAHEEQKAYKLPDVMNTAVLLLQIL